MSAAWYYVRRKTYSYNEDMYPFDDWKWWIITISLLAVEMFILTKYCS